MLCDVALSKARLWESRAQVCCARVDHLGAHFELAFHLPYLLNHHLLFSVRSIMQDDDLHRLRQGWGWLYVGYYFSCQPVVMVSQYFSVLWVDEIGCMTGREGHQGVAAESGNRECDERMESGSVLHSAVSASGSREEGRRKATQEEGVQKDVEDSAGSETARVLKCSGYPGCSLRYIRPDWLSVFGISHVIRSMPFSCGTR